MNLLVNALKHAISELAAKKGIKDPNVQAKKNRYGQIVVALILPKDDVPSLPPDWPPR